MRKRSFKLALVLGVVVLGGLGAQWARSAYQTPILMYHYVDKVPVGSSLHVSPKTFRKQMEFLKVHGYRILPLQEYLELVKAGRKPGFRTVVITFDDGYLDNFENAFPVLKELNIPATIFMITGFLDTSGYLHAEDLRILDQSGVIDIGAHTAHHKHLPDLDTEEQREEILKSKQTLEAILGHPVRLFSYPAGGHEAVSRALVKDAGFEGAVTTNRGQDRLDPYALHRIKIKESSANFFNFWLKLSGFYHLGKRQVATT